ncbi:MAG: disulfide bond formation protein DsbA [Peptoniphilus harei]|nr:disulfide bond formation protein DsbA [Peptoniphilus harei]
MLKIFTDVLDPFLWGLFPILRKFERKYKNFNYQFVMGGLIGNYEEFLPKNFREKNSIELGNKILYDMYRATATITKMPGFKNPPELFTENYKSSYPLDKYFLAFKEINEENSSTYMRKILEEAIIFGKNIYDLDVEREILKSFKMDFDEFLFNYENSQDIFLANRMEAFDYRIKKLPGFLITENNRVLQNIMDFSRVEEFLLENLNLEEREENLSEEEKILDYIKSYDLVLKDEIKIVFGEENKLEELVKNKKVFVKEINDFKILDLKG